MSIVTVDFDDLCKYAHLIKPELWRVANQVFRACSTVNAIPTLEFDDEPPRLILEWPPIEKAYFTVSITETALVQHTRAGATCFDQSEESIKEIAKGLDKHLYGPK